MRGMIRLRLKALTTVIVGLLMLVSMGGCALFIRDCEPAQPQAVDSTLKPEVSIVEQHEILSS